MKKTILLFAAWFLPASLLIAEPVTVTLDGRAIDRTFEGIGACSAGASSRLLIDYPEPYRSQILDYLFKPNYGAGFQHLKVEIGGDVNSTDGCEPSHQHTREEQNYHRGYEWWLMKEARQRNPKIFLDCLEWGAPGWIGGGKFYSQDNADYIARFLNGARTAHGLDFNYVGIWNETAYDVEWIIRLRRTLDQQRLKSVAIVAADQINTWNIIDSMNTNAELKRAIQAIGVHYPQFGSTQAAQAGGKPLWSSEDGPWNGTWQGAMTLAKMYNRNFIQGKMTKTIIWSPVTSYYDNLPLPRSGVMIANSPWSGSYEVQPALWATAHTTQFAKPGWKYLAAGACGFLPNGGSYVGLKSPNGRDYSIIVETVDTNLAQEVAFKLAGGLSTGPVEIWRSSASEQFVRLPEVKPVDNAFTLKFDGGCIYSVTTAFGPRKGNAKGASPRSFPAPYEEDFESYPPGTSPRYFSDQAGIFEVVKRVDGRGKCLRQAIATKGIEWHYHLDPFPETFLGDTNWHNYEVSADVLIEKSGYVSLLGRVGKIPQNANPPEGYWLKISHEGAWELCASTNVLTAGQTSFSADAWHNLKLAFSGSTIRVQLDSNVLAEVTSATFKSGMAGLGSGWNHAQFDRVSIQLNFGLPDLAEGKGTPALIPAAAGSPAFGPESAKSAESADGPSAE